MCKLRYGCRADAWRWRAASADAHRSEYDPQAGCFLERAHHLLPHIEARRIGCFGREERLSCGAHRFLRTACGRGADASRSPRCHYHKRKRRERLLPRKDRSCPTDGHPYICRRTSPFASFIHSRRRACRFETGGRTPRAGILFTPKRIHYRHHSYRCSSSSHVPIDGAWLSRRSSRRIAFGRNSQSAHSGNSRGRRCCRIRSPERCR